MWQQEEAGLRRRGLQDDDSQLSEENSGDSSAEQRGRMGLEVNMFIREVERS